jgi:crotonobetaine/carnitine-CoA ligase
MYSQLHSPRHWLLTAALAELAARTPDLPWISDDNGRQLSYGQAHAHSRRAASFFASLGVQRGDRVGMFLYNGCDFSLAWLGLGHLAATAVFLNTELRGSFLRHQLVDAALTHLVVDAALLPALADIADELPQLHTLIVVGPRDATHLADRAPAHVPAHVPSFLPAHLPAHPPVHLPAHWTLLDWPHWHDPHHASTHAEWNGPGPAAEDIACIMYTSGTSGPSKGVLMPHAHCTLYGIVAMQSLQLTAADRYYICLPLFHANGLLLQLGATLLAGMPAHIRRRFSASQWLPDIRQHRATVTSLLGASVGFLLAQPQGPHDRDHALRAVMVAPNVAEHEAQFHARFGVQDVISGFGMTEVNAPIWGRIGQPAPGAAGWVMEEYFEVRIADPETDLPLPPGEMGELLVRPKVPFGFMAGYFNAPEKTVEAWRNLWFHTGDAATMRADGLVTYVDRIKDCIRRRGENISATEVESVVHALPGIAEVAAYAVPSDIPGGEDEVMLALVAQEGATVDPAEIARLATRQLPRFAAPRFVKVVPVLPKTATGKVQRAVLRRQGVADAVDVLAEREARRA